MEHMSGIDAARQFTAEAFRVLRPGGVFFVVVPDYLKERTFFWDVDYTHNFVTTERRCRQLFNDNGFTVERVVRSIGVSTGLARDVLAAGAVARQLPRRRRPVAAHRHRGPAVQGPQEPVRDADVRRAQALIVPAAVHLGARGHHRRDPGVDGHADRHGARPSAPSPTVHPLAVLGVAGARGARPRRDDLALGAAAARDRRARRRPARPRASSWSVPSSGASCPPASAATPPAPGRSRATPTVAARPSPPWPSTACSAWWRSRCWAGSARCVWSSRVPANCGTGCTWPRRCPLAGSLAGVVGRRAGRWLLARARPRARRPGAWRGGWPTAMGEYRRQPARPARRAGRCRWPSRCCGSCRPGAWGWASASPCPSPTTSCSCRSAC